MRKILFLFIAISVCLNCSDPNRDDLLGISIRLSNVSQYDFKNILVNTSTDDRSFEDLDAGQTSDYQIFDIAYRYAFIELEIDGQTFTIQPIDYVGETPLQNRLYTYQLNANDSNDQYGRLTLTLIED